MSQLQLRNDLLGAVKATLTPLIGSNLAFENQDFNSEGLSAWCSFNFIPATSESMGKSIAGCDDDRGFVQVSVYVKTNALDYDNEQLTIIDELKKTFFNNATIGTAYILDVTTNNGFTVESWYKRVVTINYSSYQNRG